MSTQMPLSKQIGQETKSDASGEAKRARELLASSEESLSVDDEEPGRSTSASAKDEDPAKLAKDGDPSKLSDEDNMEPGGVETARVAAEPRKLETPDDKKKTFEYVAAEDAEKAVRNKSSEDKDEVEFDSISERLRIDEFRDLEQKDLDALLKSAEKGNSEDQLKLGFNLLLEMIKFGKKNDALKWLREAALQGERKAQFLLGTLQYHGIKNFVTQNINEGMAWLRKSAFNKQTDVYFHAPRGELRLILEEILHVNYYYNDSKFVSEGEEEKLQKEAEAGNPQSQYILGEFLYDQSKGSIRQKEVGLMWVLKAANQGNSKAQNLIGDLLYNREIVSIADKLVCANGKLTESADKLSMIQAFEWYQKSAKQNNPKGKFNLAYMI